MSRTNITSSIIARLLLLIAAPLISTAQPANPPPNRPARPPMPAGPPPARLIEVTKDSITFRPAAAPGIAPDPKAKQDPNDQTLTLNKDQTRVVFGVVQAERLTNTGQRVRMMRFEPGEIADLEAGQLVQVTAKDGVATQIQVVPDPDAPLPAPATILSVGEKSLTIAPAPAPGAAGAAAPAERTYTLDPAATRVSIVEVADERVTAAGQTVRSLAVRRGTPADLKPGQLVELRARGDTATNIRIVPPPVPGNR